MKVDLMSIGHADRRFGMRKTLAGSVSTRRTLRLPARKRS
jgi:hypothetical protein